MPAVLSLNNLVLLGTMTRIEEIMLNTMGYRY